MPASDRCQPHCRCQSGKPTSSCSMYCRHTHLRPLKGGGSSIQATLSSAMSPDGTPNTFLHPWTITLSKSPAQYVYPVTYLQQVNNKPVEQVINRGAILDRCDDSATSNSPTCGWYSDPISGARVLNSQVRLALIAAPHRVNGSSFGQRVTVVRVRCRITCSVTRTTPEAASLAVCLAAASVPRHTACASIRCGTVPTESLIRASRTTLRWVSRRGTTLPAPTTSRTSR